MLERGFLFKKNIPLLKKCVIIYIKIKNLKNRKNGDKNAEYKK